VDEVARFNKERWDALAAANVEWSRPALNLDAVSARPYVDPKGIMGELSGKKVLCLAGGGGQQSVAFALLGADVTVFDLSDTQLERDKIALAHYKLTATIEQGDMRDLSRFVDNSFDLIWHGFSINFVPDVTPVFDEVKRVMRPEGLYRLEWHNPFVKGLDETNWTGNGYALKNFYENGELFYDNPNWDIYDVDGTHRQVEGPREFNHTLSTVINGIISRGFTILGIWEEASGDRNAALGTWDHMKAVAPPWLTLWASYNRS
jgi:SAM-dependent methyltransferase